MAPLSEEIKLTFENVLSVFHDAAILFNEVDFLMEEAGYRCPHGNAIITEHSKSIENPRLWVIPYLERYYQKAERPGEVLGVGLFFVSPNQEAIRPVIVAGFFKMRPGGVESKGYVSALKEGWFRVSKGGELGKFHQVSGLGAVESSWIRGVDLEAVEDGQDLAVMVVMPLVTGDGGMGRREARESG